MNQHTNPPVVRILVVDDEAGVRKLLVRFLNKDGYECDEAVDGRDALGKLAASRFDAVFTDLRMPRMGGMELLTEARKLDPMLAIIVVTGLADRQTPVQAMELGAWGGWPSPSTVTRSGCRWCRFSMLSCAMMHDIGKIGNSGCILQKPGSLTAEEYSAMKRHAEMGARILDGTTVPMLQMARQIAMNHHERLDGLGYPKQLRGEQIPQVARIVLIVDVFDALSHDRVYRPARTAAEVFDMLSSERGGAFDPAILDLFLERIGELTEDLDESGLPPLAGMLDPSSYRSDTALAVVH